MTIEIGSWYFVTFAAAIGVAIVFFWAMRKQAGYRQDVIGKVKVVVHRMTGWPLIKVVPETPDGWVRVDKGDYKLPKDTEQKAAFDALSEDEKHKLLGEKQVIPPAMEWSLYPERPLLGLKQLQTPIRTVHFDENDPRPRTWLRQKEPEVTAVVAQAHTRQMDALVAGVRSEQLEKQTKHVMDAIANMARKNIVYLLLGGNIAATIVAIIMLYRGQG